MAFPINVNSQIPDAITQSLRPIDGAAVELLGDIVKALGVAKQKGLSDDLLSSAVSHAASIVGLVLPDHSRQKDKGD